jgi:hypothetical protein
VGSDEISHLIGRWNGRAWRMTTLPATDRLVAVSCRGAAWCMAAGDASPDTPLADLWNGRSWRAMTGLQAPAHGDDAELNGISCTSRSRCVAVGMYTAIPSEKLRNFAELWNGTRWRLLAVPGPGGLGEVSCTSASSCLAVGQYSSHFSVRTIAAQWNGRSWQLTPPVQPGGLAAVSCLSATQCVAVGQATSVTLAELWNGSRWQRLRPVNP